jgi:hypothetical protein
MTGLQPDEDVQMVIALELRLLQPEVRASAGELGKLLHTDFHEWGASGRKWDGPGTILALTPSRPPRPRAAASRGRTRNGCGNHWHPAVRWRHACDVPQRAGSAVHPRSSIWLRTGAEWCLYFHQGTLSPDQLSIIAGTNVASSDESSAHAAM